MREYLRQAKALWKKIQVSMPQLKACGNPALIALEEALKKYQNYLLTFVDQIDRRLLQKEAIPHEEKIFCKTPPSAFSRRSQYQPTRTPWPQ